MSLKLFWFWEGWDLRLCNYIGSRSKSERRGGTVTRMEIVCVRYVSPKRVAGCTMNGERNHCYGKVQKIGQDFFPEKSVIEESGDCSDCKRQDRDHPG